MDNQRILLFGGLALIMMLIYQQWEVDYNPEYRYEVTQQAQPEQAAVNNTALPAIQQSSDLPDARTSTNTVVVNNQNNTVDATKNITVETDLLKIKIDTIGGTINYSELLSYPISLEESTENKKLLNIDATNFYIAQSGLRASNGIELPNHYSLFSTDALEYGMSEGQDELRVPFSWVNSEGFQVIKTFIFKRNSYKIAVEYQIKNPSANPLEVSLYEQLQKQYKDDETSKLMYTYSGGVVFDDEDKYQKVKYDDFNEFTAKTVDAGWLALIQHYFVTAWIPSQTDKNHYYTKVLSRNNTAVYLLGTISPAKTVAANSTQTIQGPTLYVGPKEQHRLENINGLKLVVDYGILTIIADPLFWLLNWFYQFVGNWGWSIILVTMVIKAIFYKLSETSYRSMARMRKLQPKIEKLKERFGDDRQKMGVAQMELFKKEKVNPLGGCLPIFVQMPVFIGLYWMLMESVEIRQAPWILWIQDLSVADPYFILPLIMGITMFVQQRLNPAPVDPIQQKVFMILPLVFTIFFAFFPAGLVLYWVINNLLSITQQYYITRHVLAEK